MPPANGSNGTNGHGSNGLSVRPPPSASPLPASRDSRFESAQDADDIYALYGRDSWVETPDSHGSVHVVPGPVVNGAIGTGYARSPLREASGTEIEELDGSGSDMSESTRAHDDGELAYRIEIDEHRDPEGEEGAQQNTQQHVGYQTPPDNGAPALTSLPASPTQPAQPPPSAIPAHLKVNAASMPDRSTSLSPPGSSGGSPIHPSITRVAATTQRSVSGASGSSRASGQSGQTADSAITASTSSVNNDHSLAASQASLASSVQYPGEEADAYFVRSTYARLDAEGVYGDGWDEGVERTRGGMSHSASRATMVFPSAGAMSDRERAFLSKLDRFGFVNTSTKDRNEDRLALIPAAPLKKVPKLRVRPSLPQPSAPPPMDPTAGGDGNTPSPRLPMSAGPSEAEQSKQRAKEQERVEKWMKMMSIKERDSGGNITGWGWSERGDGAKHPTRVYKGIPDRWRMAAWWTLAEGRASKASRMRSHGDLQADYVARRELPSTFDVQIDLDVPRTISGHALFKTRFGRGQRSLFHVLHAFSQACGTCGYCQGMGSIAATLLCYYEPERTYTLLVRLHDLYDMHGIFAPGFPGLLETFYVQERLIEATMPDVYANFQKHMISSTAWGPKIYITLLVNTVPFNTQLRIWDALFLDGYDVMVCAVLAILWAYRDLLASPKASFESILSLLSSFYVPEDEDALLNWMRRFLWASGTRERIQFWRREWRGLVAQDKHHDRLL